MDCGNKRPYNSTWLSHFFVGHDFFPWITTQLVDFGTNYWYQGKDRWCVMCYLDIKWDHIPIRDQQQTDKIQEERKDEESDTCRENKKKGVDVRILTFVSYETVYSQCSRSHWLEHLHHSFFSRRKTWLLQIKKCCRVVATLTFQTCKSPDISICQQADSKQILGNWSDKHLHTFHFFAHFPFFFRIFTQIDPLSPSEPPKHTRKIARGAAVFAQALSAEIDCFVDWRSLVIVNHRIPA